MTEKEELKEALSILADVLNQACSIDDELDSMAISAYADGLRFLSKHNLFKITREGGRRVIGVFI
jgi:hypothetical protein